MQTRVSVIIPTKNVSNFLKGCIESVRACNYPQELVEIVVVDNGSSDSTVELARSLGATVLSAPDASISGLRNLGATHSSAEVLAFLDADCLAGPSWLQAGVENVLQENCIAGCLYELPENPGWIEADWFAQRESGRHQTTHTGAGNLFVSRELFNELKGFDETLVTGEDTEFCARAAKRVRIISDDRIEAIHLGNPKSLAQFIRREIWYGLGAFGSFRQNWFDKPLLGTVAFGFLTLLQILGLLRLFVTGERGLIVSASLGVIALLLVTLWYRRKFLKNALQAARLSLLYYLYYLGRCISLFYIVSRKHYYHGIKESNSKKVD